MKFSLPSFLFLFCLMSPSFLKAQSISDCNGAIVLCDDIYYEEQAPLNYGSVYEFTGVCNQNLEQSSVWYTFTVQQAGALRFVLTPNDLLDDYDWGLFDITSGGCAGIGSNSSPQVSCNSWGIASGNNGATGISTPLGGVSNSAGPGNFNGPPFNADLPVQVGRKYALVVMNWSNSPYGYTIDFSSSTASLFDNVSPTPQSITANCSNSTLTVVMSEPILTSSIQPNDFLLIGNGGTNTFSSAAGLNPGAQFNNTIVLTLANPISVAGTYTLNFTDINNYIVDGCTNPGQGTIDIELSAPLLYQTASTPACNGTNGSVIFSDVSGGSEPYTISVNGIMLSGNSLDNLDAGSYPFTITDANFCFVSGQITVPNHLIDVQIGQQDVLNCLNETIQIENIQITPDQVVTYEWSALSPTSIILGSLNEVSPVVGGPGVYGLVVTEPTTGCQDYAIVEVFATGLDEISPTPVSLQTNCSNNSFTLVMSEPVVTSSIQPEDFLLISNGVVTQFAAAIAQNPQDPTNTTIILTPLIPPSTGGTYTLNFTDVSGNIYDPCLNPAQATIDIVLAAPLAYTYEVVTACNGGNGSIEITGISGGTEPYSAFINGVPMTNLYQGNLFPSDYPIVISDAENCIINTQINVPNHNITVFLGLPDTLSCINRTVFLNNVVVTPEQEVNYQWSIDSESGIIVGLTTAEHPEVSAPGTYSLIVTHPGSGCSAHASVEVFAEEIKEINEDDLIFPNIVSPNNDGKNDYWLPVLRSEPDFDVTTLMDEFELRVFNRWGNLIFSSESGSDYWNPGDIESGVYFYTFRYKITCGQVIEGNIESSIQVVR